jgi:hypothetical protein
MRYLVIRALVLASLPAWVLGACTEGRGSSEIQAEVLPEIVETQEALDAHEVEVTPPVDPQAAARAFRLYYRERVERALLAYNRFQLFGDVGWAATIGKAGVARSGADFEVVAGPNDNNHIGVSVWATWNAWRVFGGRPLELSLVRMFDGLAFLEAVSGHPGLTARHAVPGWTRTVDGLAGTVTRLRDGLEVFGPTPTEPALEAEILATFWNGVRFTYREDPSDYLLRYMPANEVGGYATTYSFSMLPRFLRVSDCCTSLMRTPAPFPWQGAFWSNHNSRDNLPDLATGYLVAQEALSQPDLPPQVRAAAQRAVEAGKRVGDSIAQHGGRLMTVGEHDPYDTLVVAGGVRPDGETENEDLGSLSDCQMVFLARALSSQGLSLPLPELPCPGSLERLLQPLMGGQESCPVIQPVRTCTRLEEAYCGKDWSTIHEMKFGDTPWLDFVQSLEDKNPGTAQNLIGGFQDDFYEKNIAMLAVVNYARARGDQALLQEARTALGHMTALMRRYADIIYTTIDPARRVQKHYEAALFDANGGLAVDPAELDGFAHAESQAAWLDSLLVLPDTQPWPLMTDEEIRQQVMDKLATRSDSVKARYAAAYGDAVPVRRAGEGYEAMGYHPEHDWPWAPVERPHHQVVGGMDLLEALPLCLVQPGLLDCAWARLGCARPDLDASGAVDAADLALLDAGMAKHGAGPCGEADRWCGGADLDRSGTLDAADQAFMQAAQGCFYSTNGTFR